jgi:hypothetical protein
MGLLNKVITTSTQGAIPTTPLGVKGFPVCHLFLMGLPLSPSDFLGAHISRISEETPEKLQFFKVYNSQKTNSIWSQNKNTTATLPSVAAFHPPLAVHHSPPATVILVTMLPPPSSS